MVSFHLFIEYSEWIKGYKLWCHKHGNQKCIISRDIVFSEDQIGYKHDGDTQDIDGHISRENILVEVEIPDQNTDSTKTGTQEPQFEEEQVEIEQQDEIDTLRDYTRRNIHPPVRFG